MNEDAALLARCALWDIGEDLYLFPSPPPVPALMIAALEEEVEKDGSSSSLSEEERRELERRMSFSAEEGAIPADGTSHKTELRSPPPPNELSLARRGAEEIACLLRVLGRMGPTAAASVSPNYFSATAVHCHVNVRCAEASGDPLGACEILAVWLEWVRFDLITMRLARPWCWREPWSAPLWATGAEFAMGEAAWEQGGQAFADEGAGSHIYDVAKFIQGIRKVLNSDAFAAVAADDEAARVSLLFDPFDDVLGFKPYTSALSRYCSLNLESLQKHGTLEFRRFHGSCDPRAISHWAAFCVAFVESARHTSSSSLFARVFLCGQQHDGAAAADADEDADFDEGLEALRVAQETASVEGLVERLGPALDRSTLDFLLQDALGYM